MSAKRSLPLFSLSFWSLALCGLLVFIGNLLGIGGNHQFIFPQVDDAIGLLATSFLLGALGCIPFFFQTNRK